MAFAQARAGEQGRAIVVIGDREQEVLIGQAGEGRFLVRAAPDAALPVMTGGASAPASNAVESRAMAAGAPFGSAVIAAEDLFGGKVEEANAALSVLTGPAAARDAAFGHLFEPGCVAEARTRLAAGSSGPIELVARAFPDTTIVLDHVGTPIGRGSYAGRLEERFPIWRDNIRELAKSQNVVVKLGGLAMAFCSFPSFLAEPRVPSEQLAKEWGPYIETCIEAFGPERCMFESNFPVDMGSGTYAVLWNAFKRLAAGASADEKTALFSGTAKRVYRLSLP